MFTEKDITTLTSTKQKTNSYCVIKDHIFDDILEELYQDVQVLKDKLRPAKMSKARGKEEWEDEIHRGDSICWVTPQVCSELKLIVLESFVQRMLNECGALRADLGLSPEYTCQFAVYPGKGEGYNRHKDAFSTPPPPPKSSDIPTTQQQQQPLSRQLTCLLYLNKDWEPANGGQLRVFTHPGVHMEKGDDPFNFWGVNGYDINPLFGRLIVFRSELVEHAVLPCFKERMALTFWVNGTGPLEKSIVSTSSVFKFDADAPKPIINQHDNNDSDIDSDTSSDEESVTIEVVYAVHDLVEVKMNGLWVDGTVTAVSSDTRYTVTTTTGTTITNKGKYEIRSPGPKHTGSLLSKTACSYDWIAFKERWRDMSQEERGAKNSVLFGDNKWACCDGEWNSPPCARK